MKIVFYGSDDFAFEHFQALVRSEHEVCACVTQPDKAKGRGMRVIFSEIKQFALDQSIPVFQPEDLSAEDFVAGLKKMNADLFVVIAYGRFLPEDVLNIPRYFSINVHGSLLPRYRGAAPINWAIINGEKETGLSIIRMNAKMDAGDILATKTIMISEKTTALSLREEMKQVGPDFLVQTIGDIEAQKGEVSFIPQDPAEVTFASKIQKDTGKIDWCCSAHDIARLVRGLLPYPAAYTFFSGKKLKVLESEAVNLSLFSGSPGDIIDVTKESISVVTGEGALKLLYVHLESSKPMSVSSFLLGHQISVGMRLG